MSHAHVQCEIDGEQSETELCGRRGGAVAGDRGPAPGSASLNTCTITAADGHINTGYSGETTVCKISLFGRARQAHTRTHSHTHALTHTHPLCLCNSLSLSLSLSLFLRLCSPHDLSSRLQLPRPDTLVSCKGDTHVHHAHTHAHPASHTQRNSYKWFELLIPPHSPSRC